MDEENSTIQQTKGS